MNRKWSVDDVRELRALAADNKTIAQICALTGRTRSAIVYRIRDAGIDVHKGKPRVLTPTQELEIVAWWKARRALGNNKTIAQRYGVAESTITMTLKRARSRQRADDMASRARHLNALATGSGVGA